MNVAGALYLVYILGLNRDNVMSSVECSLTYRSDVLNIDVDCDVEVDSDGCTVIQSC